MEDEKFQMLTAILESMKNEDVGHYDLGHAIGSVINRFGTYLDDDQKKEVLHEFVRYDETRKEKEKKRKQTDEKEEQREMLKRFISGEQFEF